MWGELFIIVLFTIILYFFYRVYLYYLIEDLYNKSYLAKEETSIDIDEIRDAYINLFDENYIY